jgi:RNA polymerase sigma factor (sigma-70 family)
MVIDAASQEPSMPEQTPAPALEELFSRHGAAVRRLCAVFQREAADRDDLAQDIWLAVWRAWHGFRGECSERTFILRIAHNRALSRVCRARLPSVDLEDAADVMDSRPGPERTVASLQDAERLMEGMRRLPLVSRQVMSLSLEGIPQREIAEILGTSESNVAVRMHRARSSLRTWLEEGR